MISDYQIFQRNELGIALITEKGMLPQDFQDGHFIMCRVVKEDNNLMVVNWTACDIKDGYWSISLRVPEGGLYRFEVYHITSASVWAFEREKRIKLVRHFGVGDLYIIAGQSNMAGYGLDPAYDPPCIGVHLYANNGKWDVAAHPLNDSTETIYPENAEYTSGTSPALSFARNLKIALGIPIGLVQASLGGSPISAWHPNMEGHLYHAMLRRIENVGLVKGVIWYQGCTDAEKLELAERYYDDFKSMVELWRKELGKLHFITVQLNRWFVTDESLQKGWGIVRDAQRRAALEIENIYVVSSTDMGMSDGIHNSSGSNVIIGERMASAALCKIYGKQGYTAPNILSVEYIDSNHIRVNLEGGHRVWPIGGHGDGFQVEDAEGLINCTTAISNYQDNCLIMTTEREFHLPAKFHALWKCIPPQFVPKDINGMPLLSCYGMEIKK